MVVSGQRVAVLFVGVMAVVVGACISDERSGRDDSAAPDVPDADAGSETATPACDDGARECLSYELQRTCTGGEWVEAACADDSICIPGDGRCQRGQYTCLGLLLCSTGCKQGEAGCGDACSAGATIAAVDAIGRLNACQCEKECWPVLCGKLFPWPTYAEISDCVVKSCPEEGAACVGNGVTGVSACKAVRDCALDCGDDSFCLEGCFEGGTAEAQVAAAFYLVCVRGECGPEPTPGCLFNAQADKCKDLWNACDEPSVGVP